MNYKIHNMSLNEHLCYIDQVIKQKKQVVYEGYNASKIVDMKRSKEFEEVVLTADILTADGKSIVWASKILGKTIKERISGIDLMQKLVHQASLNNHKVYLLGAKEEIVSKVARNYNNQFQYPIITNYRNGYFKEEEEEEIIDSIRKSEAQYLFIGITSPFKEQFISRHRSSLSNIPFIMGVGGSFDVISGTIQRAPLWMQNFGLEWFYRLSQEPGRLWKRYLYSNSLFIYFVFKYKLKSIFKS